MADSEKLTALKKAYAEIILNTAKEAAARIMVSERKALRYQQELFAAKDEALHMLLRLKQMLDAKVNEAEMMSLNQQKRIEELEAQLGEAEDIVRDLRAELREVQDELEKLTKNSMQCSSEQKSGHDVAASEEMSNVKTISDFGSVRSSLLDAQTDIVTVSDIKSSCPSGTNVGIKCSCKDNCYVCNPDFASIVMRRKEPDLYRNGCTQRIRALERCLLNENLSLSGQVDDAKNENAREDDERKDMRSKSSLRTDNGRPEERTNEFKTMQNDVHDIIRALPLGPFRKKRKRGARYKKNRATSPMYMCDRVIATHQESDLLCAESFSHAADENARFGEDSRIINHDALKGSQSPSIPSSPPNAVKAVTESGYEKVDNDENNDKLLVDKKQSTRLDGGLVENLGDAFCKPDLEMVDVSAVNSDVKVSEGSSTQLVNNKFLMYTRKRKKDPLSSPDRDCSLDNDNSKRKTEDKRNGSLDSEKSTLTTESSRDSRRLAQVARQLISLSEKKWR
ncbi:hypothetical protein E1A91_D11G032600v1 [Gossypium mustelinum]|uniref:Uncharacterized protein n=3 Tax=Gossypium TaxID=3633 RepID=A0A5J5P684_GOSBA|nr:hypothetical protein ES319_D11G032500v1 [Gossypium barbadense]TYG43645.1 hypothetical protein ES288_D11G034200v1 [Gossypium darwinii]TYI53822.1 hypothetical protein E1A91_D11G032600v1 [Gossypium mustelinum]